MKYTNFKTLTLMLSTSALLVLSGCDGTEGIASNSGLGEVPIVTPPAPDDPATPIPDDGSTDLLGDSMMKGGLVWDNWTTSDADGTGLPIGITSVTQDFVRCKSCHGWDTMGDAGGYVRRTATTTRPEPIAGGDLTADTALVTLATVYHTDGRAFTELNNSMPAYDTFEGLSEQQAADVLAFLENGPKIGDYAELNTTADPVAYTFNDNDAVNIQNGQVLYKTSCKSCHGTAESLHAYFESDGKFSEGFHKSVYGIPGTRMTRSAMGDLTGEQVADIMVFIQNQIENK